MQCSASIRLTISFFSRSVGCSSNNVRMRVATIFWNSPLTPGTPGLLMTSLPLCEPLEWNGYLARRGRAMGNRAFTPSGALRVTPHATIGRSSGACRTWAMRTRIHANQGRHEYGLTPMKPPYLSIRDSRFVQSLLWASGARPDREVGRRDSRLSGVGRPIRRSTPLARGQGLLGDPRRPSPRWRRPLLLPRFTTGRLGRREADRPVRPKTPGNAGRGKRADIESEAARRGAHDHWRESNRATNGSETPDRFTCGSEGRTRTSFSRLSRRSGRRSPCASLPRFGFPDCFQRCLLLFVEREQVFHALAL